MIVTREMREAMLILHLKLMDTLDDDYPDTIDSVLFEFDFDDAQTDYVIDNYYAFANGE